MASYGTSCLAALCLSGCAVAGATAGAVGTVAKAGTTAVGVTAKTAAGGVKLGARGVNAVLTDDPNIPKRTLQTKAAEAIGARRGDVRISDIYEDLNRTDFTATVEGTPFQCAVIEVDGKVSDAACAVGFVE
ncbi:MAG: hypothetical protein AAF292_03450 [Pseudomonadota bacterium]